MGLRQIERVEAELKVRGATPVGMWADATPYSWDRKQSVELVCTSFPGLSGKLAGLRVPPLAWPKQWTHKDIYIYITRK